MGHGPRGLQPRRRRLEPLHARPGPLARVPLGRGRDRRDLRRPPAAVPGAGALERRRPDPQGADVRAHQQRGQPRRGRQGVLVLPRLHADALLPEVPVQVPAARRSRTATWWPTNGRRGKQRLRVRAARHRDLRRRPLLRRGRRVRQGRARRHPDARHRAQPRARGRDAARAADAVVPQHVVVGRRGGQAVAARRRRRGARATSSATGASSADAPFLFCENETGREGRDRRARRRRRAARRRVRDQVRRPPRARDPRRRVGGGPRAADRRATRRSTSTRSSPRASRRPTRSTRPSSRPTLDADQHAGDAPGARGPAVGQAVLRVRRPPLAARARRQPVGPERAGRPQRRRGSTWSPATSSRCRTSGSTRGSRPGTWPSTARRCRSSTSTSPRSRSSCCCTRATCTPTGRSRPTSGTSATSTRR